MSKTLLQRISEETGCALTPIGIARDRRLRVLYEVYIEAKDETAKETATSVGWPMLLGVARLPREKECTTREFC
jgi:hypothetical protein